MDWEDYCRAQEPEPVICRDCGAAFDPSDVGEIEGHRDEHWFEWLRSQRPIPPPPLPPNPATCCEGAGRPCPDDVEDQCPF